MDYTYCTVCGLRTHDGANHHENCYQEAALLRAQERAKKLSIPLIRSNHPNAFRSGEWARIQGVEVANGLCCFRIEFLDGAGDLWPVADPAAKYEFLPSQGEGPA